MLLAKFKTRTSEAMLTKISASMISLHVAGFFLNEIRSTKYGKGLLKKYINLVLKEIEKAEKKEVEMLYQAEEEATAQVTNVSIDFIQEIALVPYEDQDEVRALINAHRKDRKRMLSIAKKILKDG